MCLVLPLLFCNSVVILYLVSKIVLNYREKNCSSDQEKLIGTIDWNNERSKQFSNRTIFEIVIGDFLDLIYVFKQSKCQLKQNKILLEHSTVSFNMKSEIYI